MLFLDSISEWSFDFTQFDSVWKFVIQFLLLLTFLLIGNTLRRLIPFLRKAFIPSALIGGFLFLLVNILVKLIFDVEIIDKRSMQIVTYHALAIGFIAMSLKIVEKGNTRLGNQAIKNGLLTGSTYMLQAILGLGVSLLFFFLGWEKFYDAGVILPLGFGQGPGNALTWDINFTMLEGEIFNGQGSFGLTIASIGFIVASVVGVIYINYYKRKGEIAVKESTLERKVSDFETEREIEDSESVDKLSIQIAFIGISYLMAFGIMMLFKYLTDWTGVALFNNIAWGFNFIFGVVTATIVKSVVKLLEKKRVMSRRYINNYQMDRLSGFAFDMMIVAGVAAIDINIVREYIWLIVALTVVGTVGTFIYVKLIASKCFRDIRHESFLINFGTLTGTASNGVILLREIDPNYETPTSNIYIFSQFPAMLTVAPLLLLLNMGAQSLTKCLITVGIFALLFVVYNVILFLSAKGKILKDQRTEEK